MNALQLAKQFRYKARLATWSETGGELIWGQRVHVTNGMAQGEYMNMGSGPAMLIGVNDDEPDPQNPGYVKQIFTLTYWCSVPGDMRGENALLGANRTAGAVSSSGRGILEFSEEVNNLFRQIQETLGVKIVAKRRSDVGTGIIEGLGYVAMRQSIIEAKCTDARYYHPPLRVAASGGVGVATVTWSDAPDRFDSSGRTLQIRYSAGATPPANSSAGTLFATVARGVGTTGATAIAAGTYSFSVFQGYTDTGAGSNERYSEGPATEDGMSVASVVVT